MKNYTYKKASLTMLKMSKGSWFEVFIFFFMCIVPAAGLAIYIKVWFKFYLMFTSVLTSGFFVTVNLFSIIVALIYTTLIAYATYSFIKSNWHQMFTTYVKLFIAI